jgi:hypothetical protein
MKIAAKQKSSVVRLTIDWRYVLALISGPMIGIAYCHAAQRGRTGWIRQHGSAGVAPGRRTNDTDSHRRRPLLVAVGAHHALAPQIGRTNLRKPSVNGQR